MTKALDAKIDELYQLPLDEFTSARNALAKTLSGGDKRTVSALVKPSLPMWVINLVHWRDASTYNALIDASEKLRTAHRSALSGRKADTRKPDELHRATVQKAFAKAIAIAEKAGVPLTDAVRETIRRALAALPGDEPAGRLTRPPEPAGFSLLTGVKVRTPARSVVQSPGSMGGSRSKAHGRSMVEKEQGPSKAELRARKRAEAERKAAEQKAQQERERREREIHKAEQALRDAERRLADLKRT